MTRLTLKYHALLHDKPILVKSVTTGCIIGLSDVAVQHAQTQQIDLRRTAIIGIGYGACWFGPVMHCITTAWSRLLPSTLLFGAFKTAVDMVTSFPINLAINLSVQAVAREGMSANVLQSVQNNLWPSWTAGLCVWPPYTMLMHTLIPLHYRVLWMNVGSLFWNGFMIFRFSS